MYNNFKYFFTFVLFLLTGLLAGVAVFFINTSYEAFSEAIIIIYHLQDKAEIFRNSFLTEQRFVNVQYLSLILAFLFPAIGLYAFLNLEIIYFSLKNILRWLGTTAKRMANDWQSLSTLQKRVVLLTMAGLAMGRLIAAGWFPVHIDEAFSWVFIVSKGFLVSMSYYPGPNNHIGFSVVASFFNIFLSDPRWVMRVPVMLWAALHSALLFILLYRFTGFRAALVSLLLYGLSEYGFFYSIHGRGYMQAMLLYTLALACMVQILRDRSRFYHLVFIGSSVLGFITVPSFLFAFAAIATFTFFYLAGQRNWQAIRWVATSYLIIFSGCLLLYTPVLLGSGYQAVFKNNWVTPLPTNQLFASLPNWLASVSSAFYPFPPVGSWVSAGLLSAAIFACTPAGSAFFRHMAVRTRYIALFYLTVAGTTLLLVVVSRTLPGARVLLHYHITELVWFCFLLSAVPRVYLQTSHARSIVVLFAGALLIVWPLWNLKIYREHSRPYASCAQVVPLVLAENAMRVHTEVDLLNIMLRMEALKHRKTIFLTTEQRTSANMDYDFYIKHNTLQKENRPALTRYQECYRDEYIVAYKKAAK